jgi:isopentenyl diphosphate isomerase/L-lactate dehydrogenase-like FMN-dependent dehydrogenase
LGRSSRREDGFVGVLEILRRELEGTMGLCGIIDVTNVPANTVVRGAVPSLEG